MPTAQISVGRCHCGAVRGEATARNERHADRHPDGFWLEGKDVTRVSQKEYEAAEPHVDEET